MDKKEVAEILEQIGTLLDLKGENPFKSRAYFNGARIVETLQNDLKELVESGEIKNIKGIGEALSQKISTLVITGSLPYYEKLKSEVPAGLLEIMKIPGMGAKKVKAVYDKLKITSIGELEYACRENRLRDLDGFGQKSQDKILQNIELHKKYSERFLFHIAENEANEIMKYLSSNKKFIRLEMAGSLRRKKETIKDLDVIASCADADREELMQYFVDYNMCERINGQGNTKSSIILKSGMVAELRLVNEEEYPFLLHHATGSKDHNVAMRNLAKSLDLKMSEYGLFKGEERIPCKDESEIFAALKLDYIPPELREDMGEIDAAKLKSLPILYEGKPFYGLFHIHTNYSDGMNTLKEIVSACMKMGFQYVGICDHSKSAFYANGLNEERVLKQHEEIETLNSKSTGFHIFKGIEADILPDGRLDYEDEFLKIFDFVVASVHSTFGLSEETMTARICTALENPYVTMLGHPTGRLLLAREPYKVNMEKVLETAGKLGKIIEINSSPYRLDLDWRLGKLAKKHGVKTALNPDAHSIEGLAEYKYGIGIARKGWFEKNDVINSYPLETVKSLFTEMRK